MNWCRRMMVRMVDRLLPARQIVPIRGDELPAKLPKRDVVIASEDGLPYLIGMKCPCGCGRRLEMMASEDIMPHWKIRADRRGRASLYPSVHLQVGCKSHFWLCDGRVKWC